MGSPRASLAFKFIQEMKNKKCLPGPQPASAPDIPVDRKAFVPPSHTDRPRGGNRQNGGDGRSERHALRGLASRGLQAVPRSRLKPHRRSPHPFLDDLAGTGPACLLSAGRSELSSMPCAACSGSDVPGTDRSPSVALPHPPAMSTRSRPAVLGDEEDLPEEVKSC